MLPKNLKTKTGEDLLIREAISDDALAFIKYLNQVAGESNFLTFGAGEFKMTIEEEKKFIEDHHQADNQIFLVAEVNQEIIGLMNVCASRKSRLRHIADFGISIKKDYWSKGIGSKMMEAMLEWARDKGIIRKINLTVNTDNKVAIALYKKYGFKIEGTIRRHSLINGKFYDSYSMGLLID